MLCVRLPPLAVEIFIASVCILLSPNDSGENVWSHQTCSYILGSSVQQMNAHRGNPQRNHLLSQGLWGSWRVWASLSHDFKQTLLTNCQRLSTLHVTVEGWHKAQAHGSDGVIIQRSPICSCDCSAHQQPSAHYSTENMGQDRIYLVSHGVNCWHFCEVQDVTNCSLTPVLLHSRWDQSGERVHLGQSQKK